MAEIKSLAHLLDMFNAERSQKLGMGLSSLKDVAALFGPDYGKGAERKALAGANADFISRGLGSTTAPVAASVGMKAEFEDIRRSRLADALSSIAQFLGSTAPSSSEISNLATNTVATQQRGTELNARLNPASLLPKRTPISSNYQTWRAGGLRSNFAGLRR